METRMMKEIANATVSAIATSPAPYFYYDHIREKIVGTELSFKKSGIPNSAQDKALMCAKLQHPNYGYDVIKPAKQKNSYKGLNRPLMHDYIDCFGSDEMMTQFQKMKKDGTGFPTIKSWFLDQFPAFGTVEKAKKEIQKHRLGEVKAKYKVVKAVSKSNNKPTSNISELPAASGQ